MMNSDSNLVYRNVNLGTAKVKAFKAIIQESLYPKYPEYFSPGGMAASSRAINALKKNDGTPSEIADLMLFYVECGTQFTCSYGDIDEGFYAELENAFEDLLIFLKENKEMNLIDTYKYRINVLVKTADDCVGWGYPDQLKDCLMMHFPSDFKEYGYKVD